MWKLETKLTAGAQPSHSMRSGAHKLQEMKLTGTLARLDCFCTLEKFNAFTFSQAQTSLRGWPIRAPLAFELHA